MSDGGYVVTREKMVVFSGTLEECLKEAEDWALNDWMDIEVYPESSPEIKGYWN